VYFYGLQKYLFVLELSKKITIKQLRQFKGIYEKRICIISPFRDAILKINKGKNYLVVF
jgi:hypothetical protein